MNIDQKSRDRIREIAKDKRFFEQLKVSNQVQMPDLREQFGSISDSLKNLLHGESVTEALNNQNTLAVAQIQLLENIQSELTSIKDVLVSINVNTQSQKKS